MYGVCEGYLPSKLNYVLFVCSQAAWHISTSPLYLNVDENLPKWSTYSAAMELDPQNHTTYGCLALIPYWHSCRLMSNFPGQVPRQSMQNPNFDRHLMDSKGSM